MLRRAVSLGIISGGFIGVALLYQNDEFDSNSLSVVRMGRSAIAVLDIALTYKRQLYYQEWDTTSEEYKAQRNRVHKIAADKLLNLICANKGIYVKVGQHIGALEYLLPEEFVQTMRVLHSDAPQNDVTELYKVIRADLKVEPEELFESFERTPLGTASLAQVHKATLKTGEVVAVKVQHAYVKNNSMADLRTMELLVLVMSNFFPDFKINWLVEETKLNISVELDFLNECTNAERIAKEYKKYRWLRIPKVYKDISTSRVLIMEYVEGNHVTDLEYIRANKIDPTFVSSKIGQLYSEMIFSSGFVHSDPHPGNILLNKTKNGQVEIILLDHGLYAKLTSQFRHEYSGLWLAIINANLKEMEAHCLNLGIGPKLFSIFACMITGRSWDNVQQGITNAKFSKKEKNLIQQHTSLVVTHITEVLQQMDRQMILILKTNDLIRSIEATLGTDGRMAAFWTMSKHCIRSCYEAEREEVAPKCGLTMSALRLFITIRERWQIFRLNLYYLYLGLKNFELISAIREVASSEL